MYDLRKLNAKCYGSTDKRKAPKADGSGLLIHKVSDICAKG